MAIDPVFSSPSVADQPPRNRAADAQRGGQDFTLPDARDDTRPAPQDKSSAARDAAPSSEAKTPDAAKGDGPAPGDAKPSGAAIASGVEIGPTAKPVFLPAAPASAKPTLPVAVTDIGALASILAAVASPDGQVADKQAVPANAAVEEEAVPVAIKAGKKKPGDETEVAAATPDSVTVPGQPASSAPTPADLLALLTAGTAASPAQTSSAGGGPQGTATAAVTTGAKAPPVASSPPAAPAGMPGIVEAAAGPLIAASPIGEASRAAPAAQHAVKAETATEAKVPVKADPDVASLIQPNGQPPAAEPKPQETVQQALAPIDLSALIAQASGKPATAHPQAAAIQDPAAAQGLSLAQQQANPTSAPTPLHVVPIEIGMRALAGSKRFDIRLDPAELGRIDVNLSISDKGEVSAKLVVDRVETLHLLQRDARTLERAFEQAGLKPSDSGVDITLRDNSGQAFRQQRQQDEAPQRQRNPAFNSDEPDEIGSVAAVSAQPLRRIMRLGGVDLSI